MNQNLAQDDDDRLEELEAESKRLWRVIIELSKRTEELEAKVKRLRLQLDE